VHPERLEDPLHWRKPRRVFVNSMSDLFHESVPDEFIVKVFQIMTHSRRHTYMILTKRPDRMMNFMSSNKLENIWNYHAPDEPQREYVAAPWPDPCIWLGVSVEDQATADERIPLLLQTPAAVRFVSYEPALGPVDFMGAFCGYQPPSWGYGPDIHQIIMGVESGPYARMLPDQDNVIRSTRDQCVDNGVKFFLKQMYIDGKLVKMPELDGKVWDEFPVMPL
jgi:protein gp37